MTSAEAQASTNRGPADVFRRIRAMPRIALILGVAVAVTVLAALFLWTRSPDYAVLYSGLADRDGGSVVARLEQLQIPYRLQGGGSTILVPSDRVDALRLKLAGDGLPRDGGVGFELMDAQPFGVSEFTEKVNYQRALEGELERSIATLDGVSRARVQLAVPESSVFVRERKTPKASVVLDLYHGRALSAEQVVAIQNLVASAVNGLAVDHVTVVDGRGHLLSAGTRQAAGAPDSRLGYAARVERQYRQRINDLLGAIVGTDNVRTQVVADIDFASREHTSENYTPNNGDAPSAIRSRQTQDSIEDSSATGGIPGALSNQPSPEVPSPINNPAANTAPKASTDGTAAPTAGASTANGNAAAGTAGATALQNNGASGLAASAPARSTNSATINYELDRTIRHVTDVAGGIRRISVAVVLNARASAAPGAGKSGASSASTPAGTSSGLTPDQLDQIRNLVRGAIGYSQSRGDQIEIIQMPFSATPAHAQDTAPAWWQDPVIRADIMQVLKYLLLAIVAWLLWRRLVKPLAERAGVLGAPEAPTAEPMASGAPSPTPPPAETDNAGESILREQRRVRREDAVQSAREAARRDPRLTALIVKSWMKEDG